MKKFCCLVFGSYVNCYGIVRELYEFGIRDIIVFDYERRLVTKSNKIKGFVQIEKNSSFLLKEIENLHDYHDRIIPFFTDDLQLNMISEIKEKIKGYFFFPFNTENFSFIEGKYNQYSLCKEIDIPFPKTKKILNINDYKDVLEEIPLPVVVKPEKRHDILDKSLFRSIRLYTEDDFKNSLSKIKNFTEKEISFVVSEIIPGESLYTYVSYRSQKGKILNEWSGKKLSQHPNSFGVVSSAVNQAPEIVSEQGRKVVNFFNVFGNTQTEFIEDPRDKKFKLIEVNLRSLLWNRMGTNNGVYIHYSQLLEGVGLEPKTYKQKKDKVVHFCYFKHEICNLLNRKGYFSTFLKNLFLCDKICFAVFDLHDIKPFLLDTLDTVKRVITILKKVLKDGRSNV